VSLYASVLRHARESAQACAAAGPDGELTYGELDRLAKRWAGALAEREIAKGDRVALHLPKGVRALAMMQAVLRRGAVYVPIDPLLPQSRVDEIVRDCKPALVITERVMNGMATEAELSESVAASEPVAVSADNPAYILYTSGSTGAPKGICISHGNAEAFVRWAVDTIRPEPDDRFANHAPFHFDLSVLDIYVALHAGASVRLIPEAASYEPTALNRFLVEEKITVWYSVPSVLQMMMSDATFPVESELELRALFFAGESFPIRQLRKLREAWPGVSMWNLYGPTETNVCTAYEVAVIAPEREVPVPIGTACSGDRVWAESASGMVAAPGEEGELIVEGPTVMLGYWGAAPRGNAPYRTGDWVLRREDGEFEFLGRIDHMVKVRGYRIELGAIEAALLHHPGIEQAAVIVEGEGLEAKLVAYVAGSDCPGLLEVKRLCAERLPRYMIVDRVRPMSRLPLNRNGKLDRRRLAAEAVHG
jgi:L-proline---[L-prolyl-carrier protein] ligase